MISRRVIRVIRVTSVAASAVALVRAILGPKSDATVSSRRVEVRRTGAIPSPSTRDTTSDALLERAVERDPFATVERGGTESSAPIRRPVENEQPVRVLGTVVDSLGGSFALCQLGATQAVILRVGQRIGDYELRRIEKGRVLFTTSDGESVELRVPRAGA